MRRYQRGVIVTFLGFLGSAFVKVLGNSSHHKSAGGWVEVFPPDFGVSPNSIDSKKS